MGDRQHSSPTRHLIDNSLEDHFVSIKLLDGMLQSDVEEMMPLYRALLKPTYLSFTSSFHSLLTYSQTSILSTLSGYPW
jgi:hypothetical protein